MSGGISGDTNIGDQLAVVTSVLPQSATASVNGAGINRLSHGDAQSCVLHLAVGAVSGSPSSFSIQAVLQHAPDNSTWTNLSESIEGFAAGTEETAAITAQNTEASVAIPLTGAQQYVRAQVTISFTGGSSPAAIVMSDIVFGGEAELAAV